MIPIMSLRSGWPLYLMTTAMAAFILAPLLLIVAMSISDSYFATFPPQGFTLRWYEKVLQDKEFLRALYISTSLALGTTMLSLLLGIPASFALARGSFPGRTAVRGFLLSPLIFPSLVTGLSLLQLFSHWGSEDARLNLLIAHTVVTSPYMIRTVTTSLELADQNIEDAARTLGASRMRAFWRITLPQIAPGVAAGSIFSFMISFDNYPVSMWLANSEYTPVPIVIYRQVYTVFDPSVAAMSTVVIALTMVAVLILERLVGLRRAMAL